MVACLLHPLVVTAGPKGFPLLGYLPRHGPDLYWMFMGLAHFTAQNRSSLHSFKHFGIFFKELRASGGFYFLFLCIFLISSYYNQSSIIHARRTRIIKSSAIVFIDSKSKRFPIDWTYEDCRGKKTKLWRFVYIIHVIDSSFLF